MPTITPLYCTVPLCMQQPFFRVKSGNGFFCHEHVGRFDPIEMENITSDIPRMMLQYDDGESAVPPSARLLLNSIETSPSGGQRRMLDYSLTQIPLEGLIRIGRRFLLGSAKGYSRGNWRLFAGDRSMRIEACNHAIAHLMRYAQTLETGEASSEDDLAAVGWFVVTACELDRLEKEKAER